MRFLFSVLYQPFAELDFGKWPEGRPEDGYFRALSDQLTAVEADLARLDREGELRRMIRSGADLQAAREGGQTAFLHCVEGGFHLGDSTTDVRRNVGLLADAGVVYITLAHLFFRQMAKNANALPFLKDWMYRLLFWQLGPDVTKLGRAAIEEMYERRILIDISHMREDAIAKTFDLLGELDRESGRTPSDYPVIATHAAFRFGNQRYNLTPATIRRIADRGGVIGLIFAQHQINERLYEGETNTLEESLPILKRHVDEIRRHGGHEVLAIGSTSTASSSPPSAASTTSMISPSSASTSTSSAPTMAKASSRGTRSGCWRPHSRGGNASPRQRRRRPRRRSGRSPGPGRSAG